MCYGPFADETSPPLADGDVRVAVDDVEILVLLKVVDERLYLIGDGPEVGDLALGGDSVKRMVGRIVVRLGRPDQRLRGHAAHVHARAADGQPTRVGTVVDDNGPVPEIARLQRRGKSG